MRSGRVVGRQAVGLTIAGILMTSCSSNSAAPAASAADPVVLATEGTHTDGQLSYGWHQDHTSSDSTPSRYTISVTAGWEPKQVSADSVAVFIADDADDSFGDTAPISLVFKCKEGGPALAQGTYIRNIGGSVDVTWRSYSETDVSC